MGQFSKNIDQKYEQGGPEFFLITIFIVLFDLEFKVTQNEAIKS